MKTKKPLIGMFIGILIVLLLCGFGKNYSQPRSGDWEVTTDFGEFIFTVNPNGTYITKLVVTFSNFTCGSITQNGTISTQTSPGWDISNNQFTIVNYINPTHTIKMTIDGTFSEEGNKASGTWNLNVSGTNCSGNWNYFPKTYISPGDISGTWNYAGSPYLIQGDITIPVDSTLTIEPGVLVEFQGHYKLNVQGRILAIGTESDTIVFTINDTTGFSNPDVPDGGWSGIRFEYTPATNDTSKIEYCKLQHSKALGFWPNNNGGALMVMYFDKLIVSNCSITNNFVYGDQWPSGGGIALYSSSPKIINNTISYNSAVNGAGIACDKNSSPQILDNHIINNNATINGGGINCNENSDPVIKNNIIENNYATSGGGISCTESSHPPIINTIIENNDATNGGGIFCWKKSNLGLDNVVISNNSANWGGGILTGNCDLQIDNCTFTDNKAPGGSGGAIHVTCSSDFTYRISIKNTFFTGNSASNDYGSLIVLANDSANINIVINESTFEKNEGNSIGGVGFVGVGRINFVIDKSIFLDNKAIQFAAGCIFGGNNIGTVSNCLFAFNNAGTFAGGVCVLGKVDFINCTFANNLGIYGAGLTVAGGNATTTNCIFWGNIKDQIAVNTYNNRGGMITVNYCDLQDDKDSVYVIDSLSTLNWGNNNISVDPLFVNSVSGDYHLQNSSPCIGSAIDTIEINGSMYYCPSTDIEENLRPHPTGSMPDMGAYESPHANPVVVKDDLLQIPMEYSLSHNYPNPFNPSTKISFVIPKSSFVIIKVFDVLGNELATLVNEVKPAGIYEVTWNAANLPSGVYLYQLKSRSYSATKKLLLLK